MKEPVFVTRSFLPLLDVYLPRLEKIFASHHMTNNWPLALELEQKLKKYLGITHCSLCANGTLALQMAIRAFQLNGKKVITTPFTYVATVSALLWENCEPVFADIDPQTLCINPEKVKKLLRQHPDAAAIMEEDLAAHIGGLYAAQQMRSCDPRCDFTALASFNI